MLRPRVFVLEHVEATSNNSNSLQSSNVANKFLQAICGYMFATFKVEGWDCDVKQHHVRIYIAGLRKDRLPLLLLDNETFLTHVSGSSLKRSACKVSPGDFPSWLSLLGHAVLPMQSKQSKESEESRSQKRSEEFEEFENSLREKKTCAYPKSAATCCALHVCKCALCTK